MSVVTQVNRESLRARAQLGTTLWTERKSGSRRSRAQCPSTCCQSIRRERRGEREENRIEEGEGVDYDAACNGALCCFVQCVPLFVFLFLRLFVYFVLLCCHALCSKTLAFHNGFIFLLRVAVSFKHFFLQIPSPT